MFLVHSNLYHAIELSADLLITPEILAKHDCDWIEDDGDAESTITDWMSQMDKEKPLEDLLPDAMWEIETLLSKHGEDGCMNFASDQLSENKWVSGSDREEIYVSLCLNPPLMSVDTCACPEGHTGIDFVDLISPVSQERIDHILAILATRFPHIALAKQRVGYCLST
jgi:hypothetical protein